MTSQNISWYTVEKDEVAPLVFGLASAKGSGSFSPDAVLSSRKPIAAGFPRTSAFASNYQPPAVMVLREGDAAETLSWLKVYARDAFPLSQFARVMTNHDWELFQSQSEPSSSARPDRWACVVLGEILAQGESDAELSSLPLSRASASFSAAIARAELAHGSLDITRTCTERLRDIESERRFVRRPVSTSDLIPIWALASADIEDDNSEARQIAQLVLDAAAKYAAPNLSGRDYALSLFDSPALHSDSVEERVVAFQRMASTLNERIRQDAAFTPIAAVALSAAAFLVGRGTSHAFLLRKSATLGPLSFVWFGLMAALMGPRGWDPQWSRAAKGIERQLRTGFSWDEPTNADICWTEYAWLAKNFTGMQSFTELARLFPRTMTIEIVPGATCQFRLASSEARGQVEPDPRARETSVREVELRTIVDQFLALATRTKQILGAANPPSSPQNDLPLSPPPKPPRTRRVTKRTKY